MVKARDKSTNQNETGWSTQRSATTLAGCTPGTMHIESIFCGTVRGSQGKKFGEVTITIFDNCGNPVSGASVTGNFTGDFNEMSTGATGSNGIAVLTTATDVKKPSYQFCVNSVNGTLTYEPNNNNVDTCKSN
jgi:hypothetical protein